jgi:hypothetical protein
MEPITMTMLAAGPGAWFVASGVLIALKAALGDYWNDLANRLGSLILPVILVEAAIFATGTTDWTLYFIGIFTGLLASRGSVSSQNIYNGMVVERQHKLEAKNKTTPVEKR